MNRLLRALVIAVIAHLLFAAAGSAGTAKPPETYFIDVEGGQATLVVSPSGQSVLIDTGWPRFGGRGADRIVAAVREP